MIGEIQDNQTETPTLLFPSEKGLGIISHERASYTDLHIFHRPTPVAGTSQTNSKACIIRFVAWAVKVK